MPEEQYIEAIMLYHSQIGEMIVAADSNLTWSDLPNDHPIFDDRQWYDPNEGPQKGELEFQDIELGDETVRMYDVNSSNISAIGFKHLDSDDQDDEDDDWSIARTVMTKDPAIILHVRFKGGTDYRYFPIPEKIWDGLEETAKRKAQGIQEASVGSLFHHTVKVPADEGHITCERLNERGEWIIVLPKAQRTKAIKKGDLII